MLIDNLKRSSYTDRLIVKNTVIHFVPDFGSNLTLGIDKLPLATSTLRGIIIQPDIVKFGSKKYNPVTYYKELKEYYQSKEAVEKTVVLKTYPPLSSSKYIIVDHSLISQGIERIANFTTPMRISDYLFRILNEKIKEIKEFYPDQNHTILFGVNKLQGILEILETIPKKSRKDLNANFAIFDNFTLIGTFHDYSIVFPLLSYNENKMVEVSKQNLSKIENILENINQKDDIKVDTKSEALRVKQKVKEDEKISKIVSGSIQNAKTKNVQNADEVIKKLEVDTKELTKILNKYEIKDATIIANVKIATEKYIEKNKNNIKKEDLEMIILKAINQSVYGTEEVSKEVKENPNVLFEKLASVNIYKKELKYPKNSYKDSSKNPEVTNFKEVTGPVRHEFEFEDNIDESVKTLVNSLQDNKYPIKVLDISSKIKDNNLDRYKLYKVTLQNTSGGETEPYEVKIKIPALINEKYFKLNGKEYIMTSQQYLNPITKDKPNEVRFISHFGTITTTIKNIERNFSELNEILNYINLNYKKLISDFEQDDFGNVSYVKFKDGDIINLDSEEIYISKNKKLVKDGNNIVLNFYGDEEGNSITHTQELGETKNEFLFNQLIEKINKENPEDNFSKSKSSKPYYEIYTMGIKVPLIFFYWNRLGLLETLTNFGIDYEFSKSSTNKKAVVFGLNDTEENLVINPKEKRQELLVNGLLSIPKSKMNFDKDSLSNPSGISSYLHQRYGTKTTSHFDDTINNMIDPTTANILAFFNYPQDILKLFQYVIIPMLLNKEADHPADLKNHRVRQSEYMAHILYNMVIMSKNLYNSRVEFNPDGDGKVYFDEDYVIDNIQGKHTHSRNDGGSTIEYVNPFSPVDELVKSNKVVKTGKGELSALML